MKTLERRLGLLSVISISISSMLGSGIFVLPGVAISLTGPSIWFAYLICGLCVFPAAVSKSELATAMPTSGGTYVYLERTFGPLVGTIAGLGLWLSLLFKAAFALVGFREYLSVVTDIDGQWLAIGGLWLIAGINVLGVSRVGKIVTVVLVLVILSLIGIVTASSFTINPANFENSFTHGTGGFLAACGTIFVSYAGVTKVAAIAEEIKDPGKTLPLGIMLSLVTTMIIYASVTFVMVGNVETSQLVGNLKPIYTLVDKIGGPFWGVAAAILAIVTMVSMANVGLMAASRFPFAMSRELLLPRFLGTISKRFLTPTRCIIASALIVNIAIQFLDVEKIAKVASAFMIMVYIAENIAVIVLREVRVQWYQPAYKSIFYPWLQIFGIGSCLAILFTMGSIVGWALAITVCLGCLVYFFYGRKFADRKGVIGIRRKRADLTHVGQNMPTGTEQVEFGHAEVVVALFGEERSPEVLVELGANFAKGGKVEVVHLTEIPEQTAAEDLLDESPQIKSLRRRFLAMSSDKDYRIEFDPLVSHDIYKTIHDLSNRVHCNWLVKEWGGRNRDYFTFHRHVGWLENHLACRLAIFRDKGFRYFRRILVYLEDQELMDLVLTSCQQLTKFIPAEVVCVKIENSLPPEREQQNFRDFVKGYLPGATCQYHASRNRVDQLVQFSTDYDLLLMGAGVKPTIIEKVRGTQEDLITSKAACSVMMVR